MLVHIIRMSIQDFDEPDLQVVDGAQADMQPPARPERIVEFGWADNRPVTGRRAAKEKEKKKLKAGSFGELTNISQGTQRQS